MDETVEKVILEQASDFSLLSLFLDADIVVKACNFNSFYYHLYGLGQ